MNLTRCEIGTEAPSHTQMRARNLAPITKETQQ